MDFPYFRVSNFCRHEEELDDMFNHLAALGHGVAIFRDKRQENVPYSLWRNGVEAVSGQDTPNTEEIFETLVKQANGFKRYGAFKTTEGK